MALAALDQYALPQGRLSFVTHGENTTFRHDSPAGRHLVRVHRPQRHGRGVDSTAAIRSELAWLMAIRAETDLAVVVPSRLYAVFAQMGRYVMWRPSVGLPSFDVAVHWAARFGGDPGNAWLRERIVRMFRE